MSDWYDMYIGSDSCYFVVLYALGSELRYFMVLYALGSESRYFVVLYALGSELHCLVVRTMEMYVSSLGVRKRSTRKIMIQYSEILFEFEEKQLPSLY